MLGELTKVDLRDVWKTEAQDFTPWLALDQNLRVLSNALDMELVLEAEEKSVGPFSADILCTNTDDDSLVLIENQLEKTDHTHLGQLMTYAAGLNTVNIVWIAAKFTDEHRAALDWLNDITNVEFRFFGLEVELWKIGDSPAAPKFNIVCKPNDWSKALNQAARRFSDTNLTNVKSLQLEYWNGLHTFLVDQNSIARPQRARPQHWMNFGIGKTGSKLAALLNTRENKIIVGFETTHENGKAVFDHLLSQRNEIELELGFSPDWDRLDGKKATHIWYSREANLDNKHHWPEYFNWMYENLETFDKSFRQRVRSAD